jgi:hypothetical protein
MSQENVEIVRANVSQSARKTARVHDADTPSQKGLLACRTADSTSGRSGRLPALKELTKKEGRARYLVC